MRGWAIMTNELSCLTGDQQFDCAAKYLILEVNWILTTVNMFHKNWGLLVIRRISYQIDG